jgi:hypothetical protein
MAAKSSDIRRLAADVAARSKVQQPPGAGSAVLLTRVAAFTMPTLIFLMLVLTVTLSVSAVTTGGFLGLGGWTALSAVALVGGILMNTVWLRARPIDGCEVTKGCAPELFALVADAASALGAPMPEQVMVTDTLAVKLHHLPRLGLLAGTSSLLEIGLPAIQTYARDELAVFITQELARVAAKRPGLDKQIERMADLWTVAMSPAVRPSLPLDFIAGAFGAWVAPRLERAARSVRAGGVLEADRATAMLIGAPETARALQRRAIASSFLDEYWHRLAEEPIETPTPSFMPYREMADFMPRIGEWEQCEPALRLALVNRVMEAGAEPSLPQRLKALGQRPSMPIVVTDPAVSLLGAAYEPAILRFDTLWQKANAAAWAKAYAEQQGAGPLAGEMSVPLTPALTRAPQAAVSEAFAPSDDQDLGLTTAEPMADDAGGADGVCAAIARAHELEESAGFEEARDAYVDACEWHPENGRVWVHYAAALVRADSDEAIACIEHALGLVDGTEWALEDGAVWFALGKALLDAGEQGGVVCLEQAIAINPALTDEALFLADGFVDEAPPDEVEADYADMPYADEANVVPIARQA